VKVGRIPGKSTSGRYVYRGGESKKWWWQCDLHEDSKEFDGTDGGPHDSMQDALAEALVHAAACRETNS
jgi:hypothetical protein